MAETMNNTCEKACAIGKKPTTLVLDPSPSTNNLLSGLFLNIHYQAPCSGKVVAWEFCYHIYSLDMPEEQDHNNVTEIQAGVWSRGQNNLEYHLKKNSLTNLNISIPNSDLQFACYRRDLLHGATIEVEEGDIVGVFVSGTNMVTVLSESEQDNGILRANIPSIESLVLKSELNSTTYSLYLEAVVKGM